MDSLRKLLQTPKTKAQAFALFVLPLLLAAPVANSSGNGSSNDATALRAFYTQWGVPRGTQDSLIRELNSVGVVGSMLGGENYSVDHRTSNGMSAEVRTYADGSIKVFAIEVPTVVAPAAPGVVTALSSVTGCTQTSGSGWIHYSGCNVFVGDGVKDLGYKVTYEKYSAGYAKLISSSDPKATCSWGTCTTPTRSLWRPQSTAAQQAVVKYHTVYTSYLGTQSEDMYLGFWLNRYGTYTLTTT